MILNTLQRLIVLLEVQRQQLDEFRPMVTSGRHGMFLNSLMHFNTRLHHELVDTHKALAEFHKHERAKYEQQNDNT